MKISVKFLTIALTLAALSSGLSAANRIVIKAQASEDFTKERALNPSKKIMTYQFMKGRYHGGTTSDSSMDKVSFQDLVHSLAVHLQKQNFYMHRDPKKGDLLIIVHYGVTDYEISYEEMMGYTSLEDMGYSEDIASAGAGGAAIDASTTDAINSFGFNLNASATTGNANQQSAYYKAQLLGMERAYSDKISSTEEYELKTMLDEERYYVVLMAYDYPQFLQGKAVLQWSTRYSVRAMGQSFEAAINDMNLVAGDYFGKNLRDMEMKRVTDKSRVEMGDIEVIGQDVKETTPNN